MVTNASSVPSHYGSPLLPPPADQVLTPLPPLLSHPMLPDYILTIIGPIIAYWALSITFEIFDYFDWFARYRIHTPVEVTMRNRVGKKEVAWWVFIQQVLQMGFAYVLSYLEGEEMTGFEQMEQYEMYLRVIGVEGLLVKGLTLFGINGVGLEQKIGRGIVGLGGLVTGLEVVGLGGIAEGITGDWRMDVASVLYWYIAPAMRLWVALFILDTWQYFLHRLMHTVPALYRAIHSHHHRLYCPYAFGALYNHPIEGFLMDTIGAGLAFKLSGMGQQGGLFFFTFSTLKTVDDHCGYKLPWDPLQWAFWNNAEYHDIHHQSWGIKTNFSQPFFICWDRWLNTQWIGSPKSTEERYRKSREVVNRMARQEKQVIESEDSGSGEDVPITTTMTSTANGTVVMNGGVEKILINGGKELKGILPEEDSGWDDNSSDGSGEISLVGGTKQEQRELRSRRAAAAR
ncbi:sphinganine hydroxylase [Tirmania nivea]|nr:sphinganine hydroxylase [Tirmania nivea]